MPLTNEIEKLDLNEKKALLGELLNRSLKGSDQEFPLSYGQEALWYLFKLSPQSPAYNEVYAWKITGNLKVNALKRSFNLLISRHDSLRTNFKIVEGKPVQVIRDVIDLPFEEKSISHLKTNQIKNFLIKEAEVPFNLEKDSLVRMHLFSRNSKEYFFLLNIHHIAIDLWSIGMLMEELTSLYAAEAMGNKISLSPLRWNYKDFITWQRNYIKSERGEKDWEYWRDKLKGISPVLNIHTDFPRPPAQTFEGLSHNFTFGKGVSLKIREFSKKTGFTPFMVVLAALQTLFYRYTGDEDIIIGCPSLGRTTEQFKKIIGYFINPLPLRGVVNRETTFRSLLEQGKNNLLGALEHQDFPFPLMVKRLDIHRDANRSPLFQVMLNWEKPTFQKSNHKSLLTLFESGFQINLGEIVIETISLEKSTAMFDLTFSIAENEEVFNGSIEYNRNLFKNDTICRMENHLKNLLVDGMKYPQKKVFHLELLDKQERKQILTHWNKTQFKFKETHLIHQLFEEQVQNTPHEIALEDDQFEISYNEVNSKANQIAHFLRERGVGPDRTVGILLENSIDTVIGILGVLKAGGAYVPLDPNHPNERLKFIIKDSQTTNIITRKSFLHKVKIKGVTLFDLETVWENILKYPKKNLPVQNNLKNLAYIIYTSGSTGKPKGVMIPHEGVCNRILWGRHFYPLSRRDRLLQVTPICFDNSVWEIFKSLTSGSRLIIPKPNSYQNIKYLLKIIKEKNVTIVQLIPFILDALLREKGIEECKKIKAVLVGVEPLSQDTVNLFYKKLSGKVYNFYGLTETTVDATYYKCNPNEGGLTVPIGKPIGNTYAYILDPNLNPQPVGIPGEIYIGGAGLARGYCGKRKKLNDRFIASPFKSQKTARLFRTGDIGFYRLDGNIIFCGRNDQQIKIRGNRIELGEIEEVLKENPKIKVASVFMIENGKNRDPLQNIRCPKVLAACVMTDGSILTEEKITDYLREKLPDYMIPACWFFVDKIPLTASGKIDKIKLKSEVLKLIKTDKDFKKPQSKKEKELHKIFSKVLGLRRLSTNDSFFELGGDSILSLKVVFEANQVGIQISPKDIVQHQTIKRLAQLGKEKAIKIKDIEPGQGEIPLSPIQRWFFDQGFEDSNFYNHALLLKCKIPLDPNILKTTTKILTDFHDSLRIKFRQKNGEWIQYYGEKVSDPPFVNVDLSEIPQKAKLVEMRKKIKNINNSLDLSKGPVFKIIFFKMGEGEQDYLYFLFHHLIIDGVSWRIISEDFQNIYQQLVTKNALKTTQKTSTYKEWTEDLIKYSKTKAARDEVAYWSKVANNCSEGLPIDFNKGENNIGNSKVESLSLEERETQQLLKIAQEEYKLGINVLILAALARSISKWAPEKTNLIDLESHGRDEDITKLDISGTVGWFTSVFPFRVKNLNGIGINKALNFINSTLEKVPHHGIGWGILKQFIEDEDIRQKIESLPKSQISFNYLGNLDSTYFRNPLIEIIKDSSVPLQESENLRDHLIEIESFILDGKIKLDFIYSKNHFKDETIKNLIHDFKEYLFEHVSQYQFPDIKFKGKSNDEKIMKKENFFRRLENRPLYSLFTEKKINKISTAAIEYLPEDIINLTGLHPSQIIKTFLNEKPTFYSLHETEFGNIGNIALPIFPFQFYTEKKYLIRIIKDALKLASELGAKCVSLTGLLGAATDYGKAVTPENPDLKITTGHATTSASVALMVERILGEVKRDIKEEIIGFLGLGSIGVSVLKLLLKVLPHPKEIYLCDVYNKAKFLMELSDEIKMDFNFSGIVKIFNSEKDVPSSFYQATTIIGATNVPNLLEISKIRPGTLIIDDSAPHCIDENSGTDRISKNNDILITEGGILKIPNQIQQTVYVPDFAQGFEEVLFQSMELKPDEIWGCRFSGLLSSKFTEFKNTVGNATYENCLDHYRGLKKLKIGASSPQFGNYFISKENLQKFSKRFGKKLINILPQTMVS